MTLRINLSEIIAPSFYNLTVDAARHKYTHYAVAGGRGAAKSSWVSIIVIVLMLKHSNINAVAMRNVANTLRDSVFAQYCWAISIMGLESRYKTHVSPMEIIDRVTGQRILFRGADEPQNIKSIKAVNGYFGITHFEEADQFAGRAKIRSILQSTMRGGDMYWNFESFNPPVTAANWINKDILIGRPDRGALL